MFRAVRGFYGVKVKATGVHAAGFHGEGILFTGYPLIGPQNRLQASGSCLINDGILDDLVCPWDPRIKGLFVHQTTFSIGLSKVKNFKQDVQKLVVLRPKALCGLDLYIGILMWYVTASNNYLGHQEDAVDYDPLGLFSNDWTDQILGLRSGLSIVKEGCALEGLCICSEDSHCAPKKGYFCKPGKVYVEARVCTLLSSNIL
ncbi:probable L-gulonolactone oxidase 6 [Nicotiana sylvestris]|uniref:probable L-gulonolactone oxidase 6 n=1 Tax=Nicotiana sylvestris TaxID=4096 RepID=UPI00388CA6DE